MTLTQLHRTLITGRWVIPIIVLLAFGARLMVGISFDEITPWIVFTLQLAVALLLSQINHIFAVISRRTILPAFFFLLFSMSDPLYYYNWVGNLSSMLIAICFFLAVKNYQNEKSQIASFDIALILTVGSFFCWPVLIYFIPLFWIGFYYFRSLSWKSFFASLIGILAAYFFLSGWSIYKGNLTLLFERMPRIESFSQFNVIELSVFDWITMGFVVFLLIVSGLDIFMVGVSEKIRTMSFFRFFYLILAVSLIFLFIFYPAMKNLIFIFSVPASFVLARYFTMSEKKVVSWFLVATILIFLIRPVMIFLL